MASSLINNDCVVCKNSESSTQLIDCGHSCLCIGCAIVIYHSSTLCPLCREPISTGFYIFLRGKKETYGCKALSTIFKHRREDPSKILKTWDEVDNEIRNSIKINHGVSVQEHFFNLEQERLDLNKKQLDLEKILNKQLEQEPTSLTIHEIDFIKKTYKIMRKFMLTYSEMMINIKKTKGILRLYEEKKLSEVDKKFASSKLEEMEAINEQEQLTMLRLFPYGAKLQLYNSIMLFAKNQGVSF